MKIISSSSIGRKQTYSVQVPVVRVLPVVRDPSERQADASGEVDQLLEFIRNVPKGLHVDELLDRDGDGNVEGDEGVVGGILYSSRGQCLVLPPFAPNFPVFVELEAEECRRQTLEPELFYSS